MFFQGAQHLEMCGCWDEMFWIQILPWAPLVGQVCLDKWLNLTESVFFLPSKIQTVTVPLSPRVWRGLNEVTPAKCLERSPANSRCASSVTFFYTNRHTYFFSAKWFYILNSFIVCFDHSGIHWQTSSRVNIFFLHTQGPCSKAAAVVCSVSCHTCTAPVFDALSTAREIRNQQLKQSEGKRPQNGQELMMWPGSCSHRSGHLCWESWMERRRQVSATLRGENAESGEQKPRGWEEIGEAAHSRWKTGAGPQEQ